MTRTRFVPLALAAAVAGALGAPAAVHAADNDLTCSASAARVVPLAEPVKIAGDCATQSKQLATFGTGLLSAVPVQVTALHASTVRSGSAPGAVTSTALADRVRVALAGLVIEATNLQATADASCVDGRPALATGGALGSLTINGQGRQIGTAPMEIPLGVATLRINHTVTRDGGVARRALQVSTLLGDVVIGEAVAGTRGTPCHTEPDPDPAPDSVVTKTVDAPDGSRVGSRDAAPGDEVTYRITYRNEGNATAQGVVVTDALDRQAPGACEPACTQDGAAVSWHLGDVPAGETRELALQAQLPATATEAGTAVFRNLAVAQDHTGSAHSGEVQVRVPYQPQIVVEHTHRPWTEAHYDPTTEPLVLDEVHYGGWGFGSSFVLRNEGTAPATELELTSPLADAFSEPDCIRRDGDSCTLEPDAEARQVMDPAGTGTRARWRKASLAIGEIAEAGIGGLLRDSEYAKEHSDVSLLPELHTAQGDVAVAQLQVRVASPLGVEASLTAMHDRDGDGAFEDGEYIQHDEALPVGRLVQVVLGASADGGRAAHDVVATMTIPASLDVVGDPCGQAGPLTTCSYDPASRLLRVTTPESRPRGGGAGTMFRARLRLPKGTVNLVVDADSAETEPDQEDRVFRVV